jgi:hypothetical protein
MSLRAFFAKILQLCGIVRKPVAAPVVAMPVIQEPTPEPLPVVQKPRRKSRADRETYGNFYYFDNLLDQMDSYFYYIKKLEKHDPETYAVYSKVGGQIINDTTSIWLETPTSWLRGERPGFCLIHCMNDKWDDKNTIVPKLMYFQKSSWIYNVQGTNKPGDIYHMVFFYAEKGEKVGVPAEIYVHVSPNMEVTPLKVRTSENVAIGPRRRIKTYTSTSRAGQSKQISVPGPRTFKIVTRTIYAFPDFIVGFAKEKGQTPSEAITGLFKFMLAFAEYAPDGIQVQARKGKAKCVFNVAMDRTAYFFKDRQKNINERGNTKPIFHAVKAHERVLSSGKVVGVKMSFRGERDFAWKGYSIKVSAPGYDHKDLREFDVSSQVFGPNDEIPATMIDWKDAASVVAQNTGRLH